MDKVMKNDKPNFYDVIKSHGQIARIDADKILIPLACRLFGERCEFRDNIDSHVYPIIEHQEYGTMISENYLTYQCNDDEICNIAGYVYTIHDMYHELRHLQQKIDEWNRMNVPDSIRSVKEMTDIIRRENTKEYFVAADTRNYIWDPAELDAELYSIRQTAAHFKSDPYVSYDDAKSIMFELFTSPDHIRADILKYYQVDSFDDLISAYIDIRKTAIHRPYGIDFDSTNVMDVSFMHRTDITEEYLNNPVFKSVRDACETCDDGRIIDKLLEQVIVTMDPDSIGRAPRLKEELEKCRQQSQHGILFRRYKMVPADRIGYSRNIQKTNISDDRYEEFAEAVRNISGPEDNQSLTK